ncbi:MAG: hypothetical protein H7Y19_02105 [Luteimonas sp.]|nr:hypothetical protein [Luteimonas sp.]
MKRFKTLAVLPVMAVLCVACGKSDVAPLPAASDPDVKAPAVAATPVPFAVFELPDLADAATARCSIDKVNTQKSRGQVVNVDAASEVRFVGWVSDAAKQVPAQFTIVLSGPATYGVAATAGGKRPDVARVMKAKTLENSGFNVLATLGAVTAGEYAVSIIEDTAGKVAQCVTTTRVVVSAGAPG